MKRFFRFLSLVLIAVLMMPSCSSDGLVEDVTSSSKISSLIAELQEYNTNYGIGETTRGNGGQQTVSDDTNEIVKADLIGAFEGACKGFEYAVDKGLAEDEAVAVIVASAVVHGAARSHQAYMSNHAVEVHPVVMTMESDNYFGSDAQLDELKRDVVSLAVNNEVLTNNWMFIDNDLFSKKYPNAMHVGKLHNSILTCIDKVKVEDYVANLQSYTHVVRTYLTSDYIDDSFKSIIGSPFDFSQYTTAETSSDNKINVMSLFLDAISKNGRSIENYTKISKQYLASITLSSELSYYDKECLSMGIAVGLYSMNFWTAERKVN